MRLTSCLKHFFFSQKHEHLNFQKTLWPVFQVREKSLRWYTCRKDDFQKKSTLYSILIFRLYCWLKLMIKIICLKLLKQFVSHWLSFCNFLLIKIDDKKCLLQLCLSVSDCKILLFKITNVLLLNTFWDVLPLLKWQLCRLVIYSTTKLLCFELSHSESIKISKICKLLLSVLSDKFTRTISSDEAY